MIRQYELVELVKAYHAEVDEEVLNRAYVFAMKAHGSQTRASGDPYFSHPLEVAGILTSMRLDTASIITALLHDVVEDTGASLVDIEKLFGAEVAQLVDGVTKLSRIEFQTDQAKQAENFRKLVLAMSDDIRVLLVKLADRLHNMRTLRFLKDQEKRTRIARETLDIYTPLAERIGIERMQHELADLSFLELHPDARDSIITRLEFLRRDGGNLIEVITKELQDLLVKSGIEDVQVNGREKTAFSIWNKMRRKNVAFEQLSDIMAFRIIVKDVGQCYQSLGIIHTNYRVVPGRFKDYISTSKPNGYQSLHTGIIGPARQRIEIQIRTQEMDEISELGVAAHWSYKQNGKKTEGRQFRWLKEILDILDNAQRPEEFLEHTKLELYQDQVFCFTPKGDLIALPRGANPVDFAYAVHSEIGDTCVGAKVNGKMSPLRRSLQNGDQVEIVTSKAQTPAPEWESFVVTGKARACIRRFIRSQARLQYISLGRSLLEKIWRQEGYDFSEKVIDLVGRSFQQNSPEDVFAAVGAGTLSAWDVFNAAFPGHRQQQRPGSPSLPGLAPASPLQQRQLLRASSGRDLPLPIRGLIPGMAVHYAACCHPLPGDRIVGIVTTGKGVAIHTIDCETLESFNDTPERWIDLTWDTGIDSLENHVGRLTLVVANAPGSLGSVSTIIGKNGGNISNLKITSRSQDFFEIVLDIDVIDAKHLINIMAALRTISIINTVERTHSQ